MLKTQRQIRRNCWLVSALFSAVIGTAKRMNVPPGEKRYIINELGVGYRMLAEEEIVADPFL